MATEKNAENARLWSLFIRYRNRQVTLAPVHCYHVLIALAADQQDEATEGALMPVLFPVIVNYTSTLTKHVTNIAPQHRTLN